MLVSRKFIFGLAVLLVLAPCVPASAGRSLQSDLTGTGDVTDVKCLATANQDPTSGIYTYTYQITYSTGAALSMDIFGVQNTNFITSFDAANLPSESGTGVFTNPADGSEDHIEWDNGLLNLGSIRTFSYQSYCAPQDMTVYAYGIDGGSMAFGPTIGAGAEIPEPTGLTALVLGVVGLVPAAIRRRRS